MAIAFGSAGTRLLVGTASTSWAVAYPSGIAAGDLLVLHVVTNGGTVSATPPTGFTEVYRTTAGVTNPRGAVYIKVASGSESGTITVTTVSSTGNAMMFRYTGVDTTTPQDATATFVEYTANTSPFVLPSITTVTADTRLIYCSGANSGTTTMSTVTGVERVDHGALGGTGAKAGALYDEAVAATGATSTRDITLSAGRAGWGAMLALRPAGGGGGTPGDVAAVAATATSEGEIPVVTGEVSIVSVAATSTSAAIVSVVSGESITAAVPASATATALDPSVANDQNILAVAATGSGSAIPPAVVGGTSPGAVLNIGPGGGQNHYEVQVAPTGGGAIVVHTQAEIDGGYDEDPYFTTIEGSPNRVQFYARLDAPTTSGSTFSRSELREVDASGNDLAFNALVGTHVLSGRTTITHLPPVKPEVVIAQLHNGDNDRIAIRTQLVSGTIRLRCRINGSSVSPDFASPYTVGTEFQWKIELVDGTANIYYNDMVTPIITSTALVPSAHPDAWYFKAGMYNQSNVAAGDDPTEYGQAELRDLFTSHSAEPTVVNAVASTGTADAVAPTVAGDQSVAVVVSTASSAAIAPVVTGEQIIASVAATATSSAIAPAVAAAQAGDVIAVAATASSLMIEPGVGILVEVVAVAAQGSSTALAPAISGAQEIAAVAATGTADMLAPALSGEHVIAAVAALATALSPDPAVSAGSTTAGVAATATAQAGVPVVGTGPVVDPPTAIATAGGIDPTVSAGAALISVVATSTGTMLPPEVGITVAIASPAMAGTATAPEPLVSSAVIVQSVQSTATAAPMIPELSAEAVILAFSMVAAANAIAPGVGAESLMVAVVAVATAILNAPRVGGNELYLKDGTLVLPYLLIGGILVPAEPQF